MARAMTDAILSGTRQRRAKGSLPGPTFSRRLPISTYALTQIARPARHGKRDDPAC
jgi:hypothetical protein